MRAGEGFLLFDTPQSFATFQIEEYYDDYSHTAPNMVQTGFLTPSTHSKSQCCLASTLQANALSSLPFFLPKNIREKTNAGHEKMK